MNPICIPVALTLAFAMLLAGFLKLFGFAPRNDPRSNGGQGLEDFKSVSHSTSITDGEQRNHA